MLFNRASVFVILMSVFVRFSSGISLDRYWRELFCLFQNDIGQNVGILRMAKMS